MHIPSANSDLSSHDGYQEAYDQEQGNR